MQPAPETQPGTSRRRLRLAMLALGVTAAHLWLAGEYLPSRLGEGAADTRPRRIEVAFVRELMPADPTPVVAPPPPPPPRPRLAAAAPAPDPAASAPLAEALPEPVPEPVPPIDIAAVEPMPMPLPLPSAAAAPDAAASAPQAFEWPPSTRLSYTLTGNYRGPVHGQARVEWLREGTRYQVLLDVSVGPSFAPLMSRRISSEGAITPQGLQPERYDEETKFALREPRLLTIHLDSDRLRMPGGSVLARPVGVQDSASQFVQLTWMFTMQPDLLQAGRSVDLPLALPRALQMWSYDVMETETLSTPAGPVSAVHVKPRKHQLTGKELAAEMWVAPSLQYLPVRIVIRQDDDTWVDLLIERLPEQAEPGR